jgi:hypothetical protein
LFNVQVTHFIVLFACQHTSPDKELRDASTEAENLFNDLGVECAMNYEVYKAVAAYAVSEYWLDPLHITNYSRGHLLYWYL